jgi:serine/threonine-protein kinase
MVGVLHGLHAAHEAKSDDGAPLGLVHRDVSPQNILVGSDGVARVLDFGVAKAAGRVHTTRDGQLKGKLAYMAPEQVQGSVTRAADIFAASVVLWEALTGRRLIQADNDAALLSGVLKGDFARPSAILPTVPESLDAVTMRGLARDPADRFATAREMARALEDAIPLATASRVGDWVDVAAKETLATRSALVASIESSAGRRPVPNADDSLRPSISALPVSAVTRVEPPVPRPSSRWMVVAPVGAALGLLTAVGVMTHALGTNGHPARSTAAAVTVEPPSPPVPSSVMQSASSSASAPGPMLPTPSSSEPVAPRSTPSVASSRAGNNVHAPLSSPRPAPPTPPRGTVTAAPAPTYNPLEHL